MTLDLTAASRGPGGSTTLSSLAHSGEISVAPRSRLGLIVGVSAVVVGTSIGSALALRGGTEPAHAPAVVVPTSQTRVPPGPPSRAAPAAAAAVPPAPEARVVLVAQIEDALRRFVAWSHAHPGARCPDAAALGAGLDPWGQPLRIVCSDQPADQIAGVLSYGPDGEPGTRDDVVSWTLGAEVTALARGPRWSASRGIASSPAAGPGPGGRRAGARPGGPRSPVPAPAAASMPPPPRPPASAAAVSSDSDGDGIPDRR